MYEHTPQIRGVSYLRLVSEDANRRLDLHGVLLADGEELDEHRSAELLVATLQILR